MKRFFFVVVLFLGVIILFSAAKHPSGFIKGKISPVGSAKSVIAISKSDSVKANVISADFSIQVNPGNYQILVEAESPYKAVTIDNVQVTEGATRDLGTIQLKQ